MAHLDVLSSQLNAVGVDDMVMLSEISEQAIFNNIKTRYTQGHIYTGIGQVLVAVNPYKNLNCFSRDKIELYHGKQPFEIPPHVFSVTDDAYRNLITDGENQAIIITGESGAGKTESAKGCMVYLAAVSGGGENVDRTKEIVLNSNPMLESFGNAKTLRNNNSSRFGKYIEIRFDRKGDPVGGTVRNFLLEKSRIISQIPGERNFHIFYQFIYGADSALKQELGCECDPSYFAYLSQSGCMHVSSVDDVADYRATRAAMGLIGIDEGTQVDIFRLLAGILHVGNVQFQGNAPAQVVDPTPLQTAAYLFSVSPEQLAHALVHRKIQSGSARSTQYAVQQNSDQAYGIRDALAKTVYERLFNWVVEKINQSMACTSAGLKCLGVLDIYGFEVFEKNGFEQLCINYVNEKLQQVYVKLKLKEEQAEYANEGLKWKPVDYHDNEVTCTLIDGKQPPGLMRILDDTCRSAHAVDSNKADYEFLNKMYQAMGENRYLSYTQESFTIQHYAGPVEYNIDQFAFKNKDSLFLNLVELIQMSQNPFIANLFPDDTSSKINKGPSTAGFKIRESAGYLMKRLSSCPPPLSLFSFFTSLTSFHKQ
mmetsp:Transcript_3090/g.10120  ORF Transcript_3090/g.10120 Transcript_3090/m.10120 type:complete len:594 (-) Transcript_3090:407-2188(-)